MTKLQARRRRAGDTRPEKGQVRLRIVDDAPSRSQDRTATHSIPSGLGGVFRVEVMERKAGKALVRIHMPKTDWHHWQGCFEVDVDVLTPIVGERA